MKKIVLCLFVTFLSTSIFAQEHSKTATQAPATNQQQTNPAKTTETHKVVIKNYCCPSCDFTSQKPGACPVHKKILIRDGLYFCEDGTTSREPGKCADGKEMIKMVDKSKKAEIRTVPTTK